MAAGGSVDSDNLSDKTFDLLCAICKRKGTNTDAEKYCLECNDYYCLTCVKVHEDVPLLSGHEILDKGQFKSTQKRPSVQLGSGKKLPAAPTERCGKHNHNYIDMYCQNHDDAGCATCMAVDHRSCHDTFYIPEFLQNNASTPILKETQRILKGVAATLTEHHDNLQHQKQQLMKGKAEMLNSIRKFRKELNDRLDQLEQKSVSEIECIYKALIDEIEKATEMMKTNKTNIRSARDKVATSGNNISQVFVNVKKGNQAASMASQCTEDIKAKIQLVDIKFTADQKLPALLKEMNALGTIVQRNVKNEGEDASTTSTKKYQQVTSTQKLKQKKHPATSNVQQRSVLLQGTEKKKYSVEVQLDKRNCNIVSACTLEDGTIILSDYWNNKLKSLDSTTYNVKDCCDLPGQPWQVCPISKQEVAVCLPFQQVVQFNLVGASLTKTKQINTDFACHGLAYHSGNLYISDPGTSVYIYSISGSKLKLLQLLSPYQQEQKLFSSIYSLAVSKDGTKIYVSDFNNGLIVLDNNGQVVRQYNGPQLKCAYGCYLTATGSLLVCGISSDNVLQFGPDGELIGDVVKYDENNFNQAVCCNQQMSKMIVGSWQDNDIDVYDLA